MKILKFIWRVFIGLLVFLLDIVQASCDTEDDKPRKNEYNGRLEYKGQGRYEHVHRDEYGQKIEDD